MELVDMTGCREKMISSTNPSNDEKGKAKLDDKERPTRRYLSLKTFGHCL
jgi:hypothetical protein